MSGPAALVVPALKRHTATVIVCHGLGDSGAGWVWLAENWRRRAKFEEVAFVFPNAPQIPVTLNMGMRMSGWYDINSLDAIDVVEDEAGILKSRDVMHNLIAAEVEKGIPSHRCVLGGFSQGGAMAIFGGITSSSKLAGVFGLSSYLLLQGKVRELIPAENPNKDTPIFMGHGDADTVVRHEYGKKTAEQLKAWGWNVDFRTYKNLPHSADPQEIDHLETFINERLPPLGDQRQETL